MGSALTVTPAGKEALRAGSSERGLRVALVGGGVTPPTGLTPTEGVPGTAGTVSIGETGVRPCADARAGTTPEALKIASPAATKMRTRGDEEG